MKLAIPFLLVGALSSAVTAGVGYFSIVTDALKLPGVSAQGSVQELEISPEAAEAAAEEFRGVYETILNDLVAFQTKPDLALAEARRDEMIVKAQQLAGDFTDFSEQLQGRLAELTLDLESSTSTTP